IVTCNELFFESAEQEVLLLLADGAREKRSERSRCKVVMTETRTVADLIERLPSELLSRAREKTIRHDDEKWLKYFLTEREIAFMRDLRSSLIATNLASHAGIDVGVVTGKNEFFVLDRERVESLELASHTIPLISRSIHLKGSIISKADWKRLAHEGGRVYLLNLSATNGARLDEPIERYIRFGESQAFHKGYKCSIRSPWYQVPSVWIPNGFLFRQIYDFPRIVLNHAQATSTDTIHRVT